MAPMFSRNLPLPHTHGRIDKDVPDLVPEGLQLILVTRVKPLLGLDEHSVLSMPTAKHEASEDVGVLYEDRLWKKQQQMNVPEWSAHGFIAQFTAI